MIRKRHFASLLALAIALPAMAVDSPPSVADFFADPAVRSALISPEGRYVATLLTMPDNNDVVVIRDTSDLRKMTVAVASKIGRIDSIHWINENRIGYSILDLRREFASRAHEFAADRDGAHPARLISGDPWNNPTSIDKQLQANYGYIGPTHDGSDDILVGRYRGHFGEYYAEMEELARFDSRSRKLAAPPRETLPLHIIRWVLDTKDVLRAVVARSQGRCVISVRAPGAAAWSEIADDDCLRTRFTPLLLESDDSMLVSAAYQGKQALFRYDLTTRRLADQALVAVDGFDFNGADNAGALEIDYAERKLIGVHINGDARGTVWFDAGLAAIQAKVNALLPKTGNRLSCGQHCLSAPAMLVTSSSDRQAPQYFVYTVANASLTGLGGSNPAIGPAQMGLRDLHYFRARDGRAIPAYVTMPPVKTAGPYPTVVLVHGGPFLRGTSWEWESEPQFLASRGYVVIQPEFRGSMGYGFEHFAAGWKQWGGTMQSDLADAASWAIKQGWADPKRIGVMGASYGGYATLMGLIQNPELFRCGVAFAGVTDLGLMFTSLDSDASEESRLYSMRTLMGDPVTDAAMFVRNSPASNAEKITQPLLIAQGLLDPRVPMEHFTRFRDSVKKHNAQVEAVVYDDEGHGFYHQNNRIDFYTRVEAFLEKNLKNAH